MPHQRNSDALMDIDLPDGASQPPSRSPPTVAVSDSPSTSGGDDVRQPLTRRQRLRERKIRTLLPLEELFAQEPRYPKYHTITFPGIDINKNLNLFSTNEDLKRKLGNIVKMSKINSSSLLIEVGSQAQLTKLNTIQRLAGNPVVIAKHNSLNSIKGTIYNANLSQNTADEITAALSDQGVVSVERMKTRVNGELIDTHRYILTFERTRLPKVVKLAEWHHELVNLYVPRPMRCTRCQRLGHTRKRCRRDRDSCSVCCQEGHSRDECHNTPSCINCSGDHSPNARECPAYLLKTEILATQAKDRLTFHEAAEIVKNRYIEEGKPYSWVVSNHSPMTATLTSATTSTIPSSSVRPAAPSFTDVLYRVTGMSTSSTPSPSAATAASSAFLRVSSSSASSSHPRSAPRTSSPSRPAPRTSSPSSRSAPRTSSTSRSASRTSSSCSLPRTSSPSRSVPRTSSPPPASSSQASAQRRFSDSAPLSPPATSLASQRIVTKTYNPPLSKSNTPDQLLPLSCLIDAYYSSDDDPLSSRKRRHSPSSSSRPDQNPSPESTAKTRDKRYKSSETSKIPPVNAAKPTKRVWK